MRCRFGYAGRAIRWSCSTPSDLLACALLALGLCFSASGAALEYLDLAEAYARTEDPEELERTWVGAELWIPGHLLGGDTVAIAGSLGAEHVQRRLAQIPEGQRFPVVVFLHGCTGIGIPEHKLSQLLDDAGYAVIMPNSFSRRLRHRNCNYTTFSAGMFPVAYLYRRAELIYALSRIRSLNWVDHDRVLLGGFSEGAVATALWGAEVDARAYIVAGWTCTAPPEFEWLRGLRTPKTRAVLAIVSEHDPWHNWRGWRGHCGADVPEHHNILSMVIEGASVHNVFVYPQAQQAIVEFARAQLRP